MADLSITAAGVTWVSGPPAKPVNGGATIARGKALYQDSADLEYKLADANTAALSNCSGIAVTDGADAKQMYIAEDGATINIGATTTAGVAYGVSSTDAGTANGAAGGICALSALGAGDTPCFLFWGNGTAVVTLAISKSPSALA